MKPSPAAARRSPALLCLLSLLLAGCGGGRAPDAPSPRAEAPASPAAPSGWLVGTGQALHNPEGPVCVGGGATFCGRRVDPAVPGSIPDPLLVKATAITGPNEQTFILASTTNIGYFLAYKLEQGGPNGIFDMQRRISAETGVPPGHVVVVSDHSHNGPDTIGLWGGVEQSYLEITANAVVDAAVEAWRSREPAQLFVSAVNDNAARLADVPPLESSYADPPAFDESRGGPSNQFRVLSAQAADGRRILTWMNYAPHATVWNGAATDKLTGDWAAWGPQEAEALYGGMGLAALGSLGATDWRKFGDDAAAKMAEARQRLRRLLQAAEDVREPLRGERLEVASTFIREPITQPILLANYKPRSPTNQPGLPSDNFDVRIDRATLPPFLLGTVFGTYISAIRIGEVFVSTFPGEPFGELEYVLRGEQRVQGAQAYFLLGGANDFFGYMVHEDETFQQTFEGGALWLAGCPENAIVEPTGLDKERACKDHWALMVSPTIGQHIVCTLQNAADTLGFATQGRGERCTALTALDGLLTPDDLPSTGAPGFAAAAWEQARALALQCPLTAAPAATCAALSAAIADYAPR